MLTNWRGDEFQARLRREMEKRLHRAAFTVSSRAKVLLSRAGTGVRLDDGTVGPTPKGSRRKRIYGAFPSRPGDPPAKQTGRLRASVAHEVDGDEARVGTNVDYGKHLELGTRKMKPRPWLKRSLREMEARVRAILSAPWNPGN